MEIGTINFDTQNWDIDDKDEKFGCLNGLPVCIIEQSEIKSHFTKTVGKQHGCMPIKLKEIEISYERKNKDGSSDEGKIRVEFDNDKDKETSRNENQMKAHDRDSRDRNNDNKT